MARIRGSTVGIVGGSIAGCAAAVALGRLGCDVHVFERSSGALRDRGSGIMVPARLRDELIGGGYLPAGYPSYDWPRRSWIVADGTPFGRRLWRQSADRSSRITGASSGGRCGPGSPTTGTTTACPSRRSTRTPTARRRRSPTDRRGRSTCSSAPTATARWSVRTCRRRPGRTTRATSRGVATIPRSGSSSARSSTAATRSAPGSPFASMAATRIIYVVPDFDGRTDPGHRRVNWLVFTPPPPGMDFTEPTSIPPGEVSADLYRHLDQLLDDRVPRRLPGRDSGRARSTRSRSSRSMTDCVDAYVKDRVLVIGDAGTVSPPAHRQRRHQGAAGRAVPRTPRTRARRLGRPARRLRRRAHGRRRRPGRAGATDRARPGGADAALGNDDARTTSTAWTRRPWPGSGSTSTATPTTADRRGYASAVADWHRAVRRRRQRHHAVRRHSPSTSATLMTHRCQPLDGEVWCPVPRISVVCVTNDRIRDSQASLSGTGVSEHGSQFQNPSHNHRFPWWVR